MSDEHRSSAVPQPRRSPEEERRRRLTELRAAISLVASVGADLGWGAAPEVRVTGSGRLWLGGQQLSVDAADVYQAARGLLSGQLLALAADRGQPVAELLAPWMTGLQVDDVVLAAGGWTDDQGAA
jgi:hypothetical protein